MSKNTLALLRDSISSMIEGFDLDERGNLTEINKDKVAETDTKFKKYFLEVARDYWDQAEAGANGLDGLADEISFEELRAGPAQLSTDQGPELSATPQPQTVPGQPGMNAMAGMGEPGMGMPGEEPGNPMGDQPQINAQANQSMPVSGPAMPGAMGQPMEATDFESPDFTDIFEFADDFRNPEDEMGMPNDSQMVAGGDPQGGQQSGMSLGDETMNGDGMGGGIGGNDSMNGIGEPGGAPDQTMNLDGGQDGFDFDFDLNTLGLEDPGQGEDDFSQDGGFPPEAGQQGQEQQDDFGQEGDGFPPEGAGPAAMGDHASPNPPPMEGKRTRGKMPMGVVPKGKPKTTKAKPGLPAGKN